MIDGVDNGRKLLEKACRLSARIRQSMPYKIHPATVSVKAKIPFKALSLRELLLHRVADLGEVACSLFSSGKLVPAIIVTRSLVETVAVLYVLSNKIKVAVETRSIKGLDDELMRMLLGSRNDTTKVSTFNILTAINHVDKWVEGFRWSYDQLCEFTHPNWSGCLGFYGEVDENNLSLKLGPNIRKSKYPSTIGVTSLINGLEIFIRLYDDLANILPDFAHLCEAVLNATRK